MKSAYELAMERLQQKDADAGIEHMPLTDAQRAAIAEIRNFYESKLAEAQATASIDDAIDDCARSIRGFAFSPSASTRPGSAPTRVFFGATVTYRILPASPRSGEPPASFGQASPTGWHYPDTSRFDAAPVRTW